MSQRNQNPYSIQFNPNTTYNVIPSGGISVIPYQRNKVRNDAIAVSKDYTNKFFDERVYREGEPPIELVPEKLEDIRKQDAHTKKRTENIYTQTFISYINVECVNF